MKYRTLSLFLVVLLIGAFTSCEKSDRDVIGEVEFYLLEDFVTVNETPEIELASVVLTEDPLLVYSDLTFYNAREHYFNVTDRAKEKIEGMEHSVSGKAFAVTANREVVYTGYFVPAYSSASVQWIVIDPIFWHLTNRMDVNLGYPGQFEGIEIPDLRNDERILKIFRRDRKLKE
ncbi:MAG: hypothetical protein R6W31_10105 [Bacteroidales bacterium]